MDMSKVDLNAPAFGDGSQKADLEAQESPKEEVSEPVQASEEKPTEEAEKEKVEEEPESEEDGKVPYSRFKKFHSRATEMERLAREKELEAASWRAKAEALEQFAPKTQEVEVPNYWKELYGESEEAKKAWAIQKKAFDELKEEATEKAIEALKTVREQEESQVEGNLEKIDENLESLSEFIGRDLTEKEESAILDIVDEFTPKDDDGNYLGEVIPFDKAWEIYQLKETAKNAPKKQSRDAVANLSGSQTHGEPSLDKAEKDKNWNPLNWNAYKDRL